MKALSPPAWESLLPDPLVIARQAEVEAGKLLAAARAAAEHRDWKAIERILAEAKTRFADHPWVIHVLEHMAELAKAKDAARFRKEATYWAAGCPRGWRPSWKTLAASPTRPRHRVSFGARPRRGRRSSANDRRIEASSRISGERLCVPRCRWRAPRTKLDSVNPARSGQERDMSVLQARNE